MCDIRIPIGVEVDFAQLLAIQRRHFVEPWTSAVVLCRYVRHDSFILDTFTWDVTRSQFVEPWTSADVLCGYMYMTRSRGTWLIHMCVCAMPHSHLCDIHVCDMTEFDTTLVTTRHPNECDRDTHIHIHLHTHTSRHTQRHTWLPTSPYHHVIHVCAVTHSYVWHDSFRRMTCLIHVWDMNPSHVRHDSFTCVT